MRTLALTLLTFAAAACSTPAPAPQPASPPPAIETAAVTSATQTPTPTTPADPAAAPASRELPPALTLAQVEKTFDHHRRFFQELYLARLQEKRKLAGTVYVSFTVQRDGSVRPAALAGSTLADPAFEAAIVQQVARMTFPPAAAATPVARYPLVFAPK